MNILESMWSEACVKQLIKCKKKLYLLQCILQRSIVCLPCKSARHENLHHATQFTIALSPRPAHLVRQEVNRINTPNPGKEGIKKFCINKGIMLLKAYYCNAETIWVPFLNFVSLCNSREKRSGHRHICRCSTDGAAYKLIYRFSAVQCVIYLARWQQLLLLSRRLHIKKVRHKISTLCWLNSWATLLGACENFLQQDTHALIPSSVCSLRIHLSGLEEAVLRRLRATHQMSLVLETGCSFLCMWHVQAVPLWSDGSRSLPLNVDLSSLGTGTLLSLSASFEYQNWYTKAHHLYKWKKQIV